MTKSDRNSIISFNNNEKSNGATTYTYGTPMLMSMQDEVTIYFILALLSVIILDKYQVKPIEHYHESLKYTTCQTKVGDQRSQIALLKI